MKKLFILLVTGMVMMECFAGTEQSSNPKFKNLDTRIQSIKKEVLELNRDLFLLEEELLFPANTQLAVFLSMDVGKLFRMDSVQLKVDGKVVANHLYTDREIDALVRGGVQRLYLGNFREGKHELVAFVVGRGPKGRDFKLATNVAFEKQEGSKYIELRIIDVTKKQQPHFDVKIWD